MAEASGVCFHRNHVQSSEENRLLAQPRHITSLEDCYFYHTMDLPEFGVVHGHWDLREHFDEYVGHVSMQGKSVLDVGTATGFLSFEAERRGATVVSFDMDNVSQQTFLPFKDKLYYRDPEAFAKQYGAEIEQWKNAYWLCHRLLRSNAEVFYGNIYDLPTSLGQFDIAIVGSVLEHLSDPVTGLASIARLTKETMVLVTPILETDDYVARFEPRIAKPENDYTWWTYSKAVYREVLAMLGFEIVRIEYGSYYHDYEKRFEERPTIVAERISTD